MERRPAFWISWLITFPLWACAAPGGGRTWTSTGRPKTAKTPAHRAAQASPPGRSPSRAKPKVYRERIEWIRVWIPDAQNNALPRVLLVGDSITQGYYAGVAKLLSGKAYVGSLTTSWSVCDPKFLEVLKPTLESFSFSVIHFNNGIHGAPYSLEAYKKGLEKTFRFLEEKAKGAKIIWAATTPARFSPSNKERNAQILARNRAALELAKKYNLPVDDLYALSKGLDPLHRDDFHYKPKAVRAQAKAVARFLEPFLPKRR